MLKLITTKSATVAAAAMIAVGMAIFFILAPPAKAQPQVVSADVEHALAKGDRLRPLVKGAACSPRSWPNYEQICQFDLRTSADRCGCSIWRGLATRSKSSPPHAESHGPGAPSSSLAGANFIA